MSDVSYELACLCCRVIFKACARLDYVGMENIPPRGPCILLANHISHFDPPLLAVHLPRTVDFMASEEFFVRPAGRRFFEAINTFPFRRQNKSDRRAIRETLERLKRGRIVGIFPERGIRHGAASLLTQADLPVGTASLAQMARVPVVPAIVVGSDQLYQWRTLLHRPRIFIRYGPALESQPGETREDFSRRLQSALRELYDNLLGTGVVEPHELPCSAQERWKAL